VTYVLQVSDVVKVTIYIVGRQCNGDVCTAGKRRCQGYYIYFIVGTKRNHDVCTADKRCSHGFNFI